MFQGNIDKTNKNNYNNEGTYYLQLICISNCHGHLQYEELGGNTNTFQLHNQVDVSQNIMLKLFNVNYQNEQQLF
jgi:hypothetical protein